LNLREAPNVGSPRNAAFTAFAPPPQGGGARSRRRRRIAALPRKGAAIRPTGAQAMAADGLITLRSSYGPQATIEKFEVWQDASGDTSGDTWLSYDDPGMDRRTAWTGRCRRGPDQGHERCTACARLPPAPQRLDPLVVGF